MDEQMGCRTPRDRIGGELLQRMLAAEQQMPCRNAGRSAPQTSRAARNQVREPMRRGTCGCMPEEKSGGIHYAMVYSPYQPFGNLFEAEAGLEHGTIFKDLEYPFYPTGCRTGGCGQ